MESASSSLLLFLVFVGLSVVVQVDAQNRVSEVQALTTFQKAIALHADLTYFSPYFSTWNESDENACAWAGVSCTDFTVTALDLSAWGLYFVKTMAALSKLPDLLLLDMSSNFLYDFPNDIDSLTQIIRLDLSGNLLQGKPTFLLLGRNSLQGSLPRELGEISSLTSIDLSLNHFNGTIPSLENSANLVKLKLNNNFFDGFDEPLNLNAPNLLHLDVSSNQVEGIIPLALTNLRNLVYLNMARNRLSGKIPSGFSYGADMSNFDFSQNQLSGSIPVDLLELPETETATVSINVSYNLLNGSIPTPALTSTMVFLSLDLSHNQLSGSIPLQLFGSVNMYLGDNLLSGDIVDILLDCKNFSTRFLLLRNNLLTGDLSRMTYKWANWTSLSAIDLRNNNLSWTTNESIPDPVTAALENLPTILGEFGVGGNDFSGIPLPVGPLFLAPGKLQNLKVLDFSNNHLQGSISADVFNSLLLPSLEFLNLSHNEATGPVPENIITLFNQGTVGGYNLPDFPEPSKRVLDVSNNQLSGSLPFIPFNSSIADPSLFVGNPELCGYPLAQCQGPRGVQWWIFLTIVGGFVVIGVGSSVVATWKWRVYHKRHEQDADLIKTLMERDLATLMHLQDLKKATNNFSESVRIGEGGFGTVYMGELNSGTKVAIKRSKRGGSQEDKQQFLNELRILSQVNHRHLVKLLGCCMENKVSLLIFEFVSNGTLQQHLQGKIGDVGLSWRQRLNIAAQTADALSYLHTGINFPIYHRDVKSANILVDDQLSAKVADFGISKLAPLQATHISTAGMGTIGYIDPEYYTYHRLTDRSDVYSFGVVLLELISAKPAVFQVDGEPVNLVMFAIPHIESGDMQPLIDPTLLEVYNDTSGLDKESILKAGKLAMKCLAMPSKERPHMNEVWKELQDLYHKLTVTSMNEASVFKNEDGNTENPSFDHRVLLSQSFSNDSFSAEMQNDPRSREIY